MENFTIFPNKEAKEEAISKAKSVEEETRIRDKWPDFKISVKTEAGYEDWGACWWKKDKAGNWYQSCSKSKPKVEQPKEEAPPF